MATEPAGDLDSLKNNLLSWLSQAKPPQLARSFPSSWKGSTKGEWIFSFYGTVEYSFPQTFFRILLPWCDAETSPFGEREFSENIPSLKRFWEFPFPQGFCWLLPGRGILMKPPPALEPKIIGPSSLTIFELVAIIPYAEPLREVLYYPLWRIP